MKKLTKTLGATLVIAIMGATSFATIASAYDRNQGFGPNAKRNQGPHNAQQFRAPPGGLGFGPFRLICSDRGETRIENGLTRIAHRIDLTDEQTAALDNFKEAALSAQAGFSQVCADFKPGEDADLIDRMKSRQAAIAAQLVGMQSIMPSLEVFFDSLSDEQKARLRPPMDKFRNRAPGHPIRPHQGMGPNGNGPAFNQNEDNSNSTPQG